MRFEAVARLKPSKTGWRSLVHVLRSEGARGCWGTAGCFICEGGGFGRESPDRALTTLIHHRKGLDWGRGRRGVALGEVGYGNYLYCWYSLHAACVAGHATSGNLRPAGISFLPVEQTVSNLSGTLCDIAALSASARS